MIRPRVLVIVATLALAGCGNTTHDRGISGAGIGAAGGAILGAVTGLTIVQGVLIGAAAGGITGMLTDNSQINLGDPLWQRNQNSKAASGQAKASSSADRGRVGEIQTGLARLGYDPGPVDGSMGPMTSQAIRDYQSDQGLRVDGRASEALARHLSQQAARG